MIESHVAHRYGTQIPFEPCFTTIRKRNGQLVPFDAGKITEAITAAGRATGEYGDTEAGRLTLRVLSLAQLAITGGEPTVEGIQDIVEEVLLASPYRRTAKDYIIYRDQHARMRAFVSDADVKLVDEYLDRLDWRVNENSNMAYSLQGLNNYISSSVTSTYWLEKVYPSAIRDAHRGGDLHIHDLNLLSVYCVGWDLRDLLMKGFRGAPGKTESKPPRHFRTALGQIVNFFYTLQGEAAGAQAFSSFDTYLAPFIRQDALTPLEVRQALQEFVFNINVPTRVGFQTPFTNLTLDLKVPSTMRDEAVIIGGELTEATYGEFQDEMNLLNRTLFQVLAEGDAAGRVFTFPIPTVNVGTDFDWEDPTLEPLWEATARYGIPYFANYVNSDLSPEDARSMCCRLRLDTRKLDRRGGGLFGANPLTGSIGVVTLNLPRLGVLAADEAEFLQRLDVLMDHARKSLDIKRKVLERFTERNLYPYSRFFLAAIKERYGEYWHNHFSTIGIVGMHEACLNLLGVGIDDERGRGFALRVLDHMRDRLADWQEDSDCFFNLEATPAEGAATRLAKTDRERFGTAPEVYTNSTALPVDHTSDVFQVLDHQDELQARYTGGTVVHVYTGEAQSDPEAVKRFVRTVTSAYRIPYFTYTPTFSVCPTHGYLGGQQPTCPSCGSTCEVYSRVVGYIRPLNQWNEGKVAEFRKRALFDVSPVADAPQA